MNPTQLMLFVFYGLLVVWSFAWLWAFVRLSSDTLVGMINSEFTLRGLGWSFVCALLALIPLWVIALVWSEFIGVLP